MIIGFSLSFPEQQKTILHILSKVAKGIFNIIAPLL